MTIRLRATEQGDRNLVGTAAGFRQHLPEFRQVRVDLAIGARRLCLHRRNPARPCTSSAPRPPRKKSRTVSLLRLSRPIRYLVTKKKPLKRSMYRDSAPQNAEVGPSLESREIIRAERRGLATEQGASLAICGPIREPPGKERPASAIMAPLIEAFRRREKRHDRRPAIRLALLIGRCRRARPRTNQRFATITERSARSRALSRTGEQGG